MISDLLPQDGRATSQPPVLGSQLVPSVGEGAGGDFLLKGKGLHLDQLFSNRGGGRHHFGVSFFSPLLLHLLCVFFKHSGDG